ncbi:MAG TPA: DUF72 domain-containing protein [Nitrospirae bacterium]|nr:DUF72 domain-containing protein [Nitrospirota bacterium]
MSALNDNNREITIHRLSKHNITYITADEPQYNDESTVRFCPDVTTDIAYYRLHGRNKENWHKKGIETSLRYAYEYSNEELKGFIPSIQKSNKVSKVVFIMFNNCHKGFAVRNAMTLQGLVKYFV